MGVLGVFRVSVDISCPAGDNTTTLSSLPSLIGSANTGFDVLQDCHTAGLRTTIHGCFRTYLISVDYFYDPMSLGAYQSGVAAADNDFLALPTATEMKLDAGLFEM